MNKKRFIKRLIDMGGCGAKPETWERGWDDAIGEVIGIAEELDEPQKPVIPQFVAEYIEQSKKDNDSINQGFAFIDDKENKELWNWLFPSISDEKRINQEMFMRAWLDGYEVEKEKRYQVKIPVTVWDYDASELKEHTSFLAYDITSDETRILSTTRCSGDYRTDLTETQIKAIDERFWLFSEEVTE